MCEKLKFRIQFAYIFWQLRNLIYFNKNKFSKLQNDY